MLLKKGMLPKWTRKFLRALGLHTVIGGTGLTTLRKLLLLVTVVHKYCPDLNNQLVSSKQKLYLNNIHGNRNAEKIERYIYICVTMNANLLETNFPLSSRVL